MPILHTEAITLRRRRTRDADALITLFGRTCGKIVASTRSVLKTTSRYAGITQPYNRLQVILYAKTRDQDIWTLTQASRLESFDTVQNDLDRMAFFSILVEWLEALSGDFQSSQTTWRLLMDVLRLWNRQVPRWEELFYYQLHFLMEAGIQPEIHHCRFCGTQQSTQWFYQVRQGGLACPACTREGDAIGGGAVEVLRKMAASPSPLLHLKISSRQKEEIAHVLQHHGLYHAEIQSQSISFQQQIDRIRMIAGENGGQAPCKES